MAVKTHHRIGNEIVRLVRTERFRTGARGVLCLPNGASIHTLEDKPIAPGSYFLNPDKTGRFQNWVIEYVLGSRSAGNGRTSIEIHGGSLLSHSAGCILPGLGTTREGLLDSSEALKYMREILERNDDDPKIWLLNISEAF